MKTTSLRPLRSFLLLMLVAGGCTCGTDDAEVVTDDTTGPTSLAGGPGQGPGGSSAALSVGASGGSGSCTADIASIQLAPAGQEVLLDGTSPAATVTFEATGVRSDGTTTSLSPGDLAWTVSRADDTPPGSIADGILAPFPHAGGVVTVAAEGCGATGSTNVTLRLEVELGAPANADDWDGEPVVGDDEAPSIVYPSDETRLPRNVYRTIFQWRRGATSEARITYEGPYASVTVYTGGAHGLCGEAEPAAGCWEVNELAWQYIAGSNAGELVTWTVDGLDASTSPPTILRGEPAVLGVSKEDVEGAIFYWSTTSAGVRRGRISQQDPEDYVAGGTVLEDGDEVGCVACHVVSRSGKYLAAPTKSADGGGLFVYEVTAAAPPPPLVKEIANTGGHGFATISPDDEHLVAAYKGAMWQLAREDGAHIVDIDTGELGGTHPDWSPLGDEVIFATGEGDGPGDASLARVPYDAGTWGQAEVFLAPPDGRTNLFPMFSPGGEWIAFSQGKGGHGDPEAQLHVMKADASESIELVRANRVSSNVMTDGEHQNSQPTWAPPGDYHWIAFNSKREYGVILDGGTQQIWVAAVSTDIIESGEDASWPAFRVPFQGLDENNHRAFWTLDVTEGQGGGGAGGADGGGGSGGDDAGCAQILGVGELCDPLDDCCETGAYCDTRDDGRTYECVGVVPN